MSDLDSISVHDIDFDLGSTNNCYGQFTYGDYLQELQELEQGRTPMKMDRHSLPRNLTNLHWLHNVGMQADQQQQIRQEPISLMVDPNTNMPVQFSANRSAIHAMQSQNITFMSLAQTHAMSQQQQQQQNLYQRHDLHQQNILQHQKYAHDKNKENGSPGAKIFPKPVFSYSCLIAMALRNSDQGSLPVSEIYKYMQSRFPYFKTAPDGWKNSVRHNLSLNKAFCKLERPDGTSQRKGCLWSLKPEKKDQLRREIRKWKKKHPEAIKASMANPDDLSISSDSCDDDSMEDSKIQSPEHTVPESALDMPPSTPLLDDTVKDEPVDEVAVEDVAKELFGSDLLFNHDDLQADEFWNELMDTNMLSSHDRKYLSEDIVELESSVKIEPLSPSTNFFSSAIHQPTLASF